jgi:hypothetical protein
MLIASAKSLASLEKLINEYFFSAHYMVDPASLKLTNVNLTAEKLESINNRCSVTLSRGRYRFEKKD